VFDDNNITSNLLMAATREYNFELQLPNSLSSSHILISLTSISVSMNYSLNE
jgi:hypothetical protein